MLIEGKHICADCQKEFDWYYIVTHRNLNDKSDLPVHIVPKGKVHVLKNSINKDLTPINVSCHCPFIDCGYPNHFDVDYKSVTVTK
ncbi:hypothetical protein CHH83_01360 [Bacillus sp. 7586-K]|nr:hypothetical protein CHH83_01360 [Bacillus sp. 7586-K]